MDPLVQDHVPGMGIPSRLLLEGRQDIYSTSNPLYLRDVLAFHFGLFQYRCQQKVIGRGLVFQRVSQFHRGGFDRHRHDLQRGLLLVTSHAQELLVEQAGRAGLDVDQRNRQDNSLSLESRVDRIEQRKADLGGGPPEETDRPDNSDATGKNLSPGRSYVLAAGISLQEQFQ